MQYLSSRLLFNFVLSSVRYVSHLMAIWCRCFLSVLITFLEILSDYKSLIGCLWITILTLAMMVMKGLICEPVVLSVGMIVLYLTNFWPSAVFGHLLWQ
jgi:hypothetical protein